MHLPTYPPCWPLVNKRHGRLKRRLSNYLPAESRTRVRRGRAQQLRAGHESTKNEPKKNSKQSQGCAKWRWCHSAEKKALIHLPSSPLLRLTNGGGPFSGRATLAHLPRLNSPHQRRWANQNHAHEQYTAAVRRPGSQEAGSYNNLPRSMTQRACPHKSAPEQRKADDLRRKRNTDTHPQEGHRTQ